QALAEHNAIFGGELSGHFYFRENFFADSGAIAMAAVASAMADAKVPLSQLLKPTQRYAQSGEINFETEDKEMALDDLRRAFPSARVEHLDGLTLDSGSWWCNVRASN